MKKRAQRKSAKPPPARRVKAREPGPLLYKVVELSTVDEGSLELTINQWVHKGWNLDGVQFAMREQSKRPAMAFVFFTREGEAAEEAARPAEPRETEEAVRHLYRMAESHPEPVPVPVPISAYERLKQLAGDDGSESDE